jgi:hypothetical protein
VRDGLEASDGCRCRDDRRRRGAGGGTGERRTEAVGHPLTAGRVAEQRQRQITAVPWILLGAGVALIGLGVVALRSRGGRLTWLIAAAGAAMVAVPLALSMPHKAAAAGHVDEVGQVALSKKAAVTALATTRTVDSLVQQTRTRLVPDLARRTGSTPKEVAASLVSKYPAVGTGLDAWPEIRPGAYALARAQAASIEDYDRLHGLPFKALPWLVIGPGIVLLVAGLTALAATARRPYTSADPVASV